MNASSWAYALQQFQSPKLSVKVRSSHCSKVPLLTGKTITTRVPEHKRNTKQVSHQETAKGRRSSRHSSEAVFAYLEHLLHLNRLGLPGNFNFSCCKAVCIFRRCATPASSLPSGFLPLQFFWTTSQHKFLQPEACCGITSTYIWSRSHPDTAW